MIEIKDSSGRVVSTSKNLRGIIARTGKLGAPRATVEPKATGATLRVHWHDGSHAVAEFADESICRKFCTKRNWEF